MLLGQRIKEIAAEKNLSVIWLAEQMHYERSNIYDIFRRDNIDVRLLIRFSKVLGYNFLADVAEEVERELWGEAAE